MPGPLQDVQAVQLAAPAAEAYVEPDAHAVQVEAPFAAYVPATHCVQVTLVLGPLPLFEKPLLQVHVASAVGAHGARGAWPTPLQDVQGEQVGGFGLAPAAGSK